MKEKYGNGTHTEYSYDPARRWLSTIKTQNRSGVPFQNMSYEFDLVGNVKGYTNDCLDGGRGNYKTCQNYEYDALYQLTRAYGETTHDPYKSLVPDFKSTYEQVFEFDGDGLGNMMKKVSSETVTPRKTIGDNLNYTFDYEYDEKYAHRLIHAGNLYYQYDANGNVTCEQDGSFESNGDDVKYHKISEEADGVYSSEYGWGLFRDSDSAKTSSRYRRTYTWNERNQLICSKDASFTTNYIYGQDGQRTNKYTARSETLYFNKMWTLHTDSGNSVYGGQNAKNIYLGDTRIVTKLASPRENTIHEEYYKQYYYHSDHLGSASLISDYKGDEYQRIEYTPYGETWVEKTQNTGLEYLPYKFTGQEKDEETGNYYIGARYLCPRTSRWLSCDPALSEYMAGSSVGGGGLYNSINLNLYHYAGNNPLCMKDPTGMSIDDWQDNGDGTWTVKSEGAKLWDVWGADSYDVTGLTEEEARNIHVGDTFGKKNSPTQSNTENNVNSSVSNYYFSKWSYVPIEGIGVNGGSSFSGSVTLTDDTLSIFASGSLVAQNLVDNYTFFGDATLFVDGNKIGKSYFQYPDYPFIRNGAPFTTIGDANFNYDFTNANSVEVDLHFRAGITVDSGINKYFIDYSKHRMKIK